MDILQVKSLFSAIYFSSHTRILLGQTVIMIVLVYTTHLNNHTVTFTITGLSQDSKVK